MSVRALKAIPIVVISALVAALAAFVPAVANEETKSNETDETQAETARACWSDPAYGAFDFWLGVWTVTTPDGATAGRNTITRDEQGCVLTEMWRSANGGTGRSLTWRDPVSGTWRQVWVSAGVTIDIAGGLNADGAMTFTGTSAYRDGGPPRTIRGVWTPAPDGSVRQVFHERDPDTGDWAVWFDGLYTRIDE